MIRIALRSDRRLFRDALGVCLDAQSECAVVGNVADLDDLLVLCRLRRPDLVLVDIGTGLGAEPEVVGKLRDCVTLARVVVIYERLSSAELSVLWRLGVDTLLPCSHGLDALLVVLRRYIASEWGQQPHVARAKDGLTEQDAKIIALLSAGHTVDQIAHLLEISTSAVANAKRRIYRKLEVASQCQAVARATALGIVCRHSTRRVSNGRAPGTMVAVLRGASGPAMDRVTVALLAGGIPVAVNGNGSQDRPAEAEAAASRIFILVDPVPTDWPSGRDADLPVALIRSTPLQRAEALEALLRGAVAVIPADRVGTDLVPALTLIRHGYLAVEAGTAGALLDAMRTPSASAHGLPELTPRECDILRSIAIGDTVRLTARALGIAEKTVENTQARLFRKLGARNRPGALAAAHALGLLDLIPTARPPM